MLKVSSTLIVLVAILVPRPRITNASAPPPHWRTCVLHLDWATMQHVTERSCTRYSMPKHAGQHPIRYVKTCHQQSPHVRICDHVPTFAQPAPQVATQRPMLITYYLATGDPMANGVYPSVGWAACGYDLSLGTRIMVPGVGVLTCGDRIGYDPWNHIDVFGVPLNSGYREVSILAG